MANILQDTDGGLITADNSAVVFIDHQLKLALYVLLEVMFLHACAF
jgi:hypothetical protein